MTITSLHPGVVAGQRQPPVNFEAEMALLAAIMTDNRTYELVSEIVRPEHFADDRHGRIYEAMGKLIERGSAVTAITLKSYFEHDQALQEIGGAQYLVNLYRANVSLISVRAYAEAIEDAYIRRAIMAECESALDEACRPEVDKSARDLIEALETRLYGLAENGRDERELCTLGEAAAESLKLADEAGKRGGALAGVATGLLDVDRFIGGFEKGNLYVIGARPSMGKTALALWMAWGAATKGHRVLFFSLEMSRAQLARRLQSGLCRIPISEIKTGNLNPSHWQQLTEAERDMKRLPFVIDDRPALSLTAMRNRARKVKRRGGLGLIVVDHLQLARAGGKVENRRLEIGAITAGLKELAKDLDVPVIVLSQLSRAVEQREDKRPVLSDLRESGDIEQDADVVMFLYRESYYAEREKPQQTHDAAKYAEAMVEWEARAAACEGKAEVIIGKQRDGAVGTVELAFDDATARFQNLQR